MYLFCNTVRYYSKWQKLTVAQCSTVMQEYVRCVLYPSLSKQRFVPSTMLTSGSWWWKPNMFSLRYEFNFYVLFALTTSFSTHWYISLKTASRVAWRCANKFVVEGSWPCIVNTNNYIEQGRSRWLRGAAVVLCWDCEFESRRKNEGFLLCCQVEVFATGWSPVQKSLTESGVSECDWGPSKVMGPRPTGAVEPWKRNKVGL